MPINIAAQVADTHFTSDEVVTAINFTVGVIQTADRILESGNWTYEVSVDISDVTVYITCGNDVHEELLEAIERGYPACPINTDPDPIDDSMTVISLSYEFPSD